MRIVGNQWNGRDGGSIYIGECNNAQFKALYEFMKKTVQVLQAMEDDK